MNRYEDLEYKYNVFKYYISSNLNSISHLNSNKDVF